MKHWYALYTKPRQEQQVEGWLQQRGIEAYFPAVRPRVRRRDRPQWKAFFPCYLFACLDLDSTPRSSIAWMPGVRRIVSAGDQPAAVPAEVVALVRTRLAEAEARGEVDDFRRGDRVRITAGPLRDLEAVFDRSMPAAQRVRVLLNVLGRMTAAEIDGEAITRI